MIIRQVSFDLENTLRKSVMQVEVSIGLLETSGKIVWLKINVAEYKAIILLILL